jgi:hypothetical protein
MKLKRKVQKERGRGADAAFTKMSLGQRDIFVTPQSVTMSLYESASWMIDG